MGSPPTSKLRFTTLRGELQDAPTEWAPALVEIDVATDQWEKVRLRRQGELLAIYLKRVGGEARVLADWPRSGTGHYQLQLECPGWVEERTLTIEPTKISPEAYSRLIGDLETRLPVSVALGLQRTGVLSGIDFRPPGETTLAQELIRLRRAVLGTRDVLGTLGRPGLIEVLPELARDPHRILATTELWARRERARRPHPARLPQALSVRGNLTAEKRPEHVLDTRVEHTVDLYENRLVKIYLQQVHLRLRRLVTVAEVGSLSYISDEARSLLRSLLNARRQAAFLEEVSLLEHIPTRLTMVLLRRPPYRAALEGYLEFRRSASIRLEEPKLDAPLENLPDLYQTWGTLEVLSVLLEVAGELGYRVQQQRLVGRDAGGFYVRVLPDGRPVVHLLHPEHKTIVNLIPERTYRGKGGRGSGLHSISYAQRPDVAVEVHSSHERPRIYLFDPKYKLEGEYDPKYKLEGEYIEGESSDGRPKKVDIDKMHAYRDAIRDKEGRRLVRFAAILYPGPETHYAKGLEALPAYPGSEKPLERRIEELLREALDCTEP
jgi:hypothetical protein